MITFDNVRFLNQPTKTNRQLVGVDITTDSGSYDWIVYAPIINGDALTSYFNQISNIVESDINNKELIWSTYPKTEDITDPFTNETVTTDITKDRVVHPTIPDYVEAMAENRLPEDLQLILNELGSKYWQYPQYAKRIIAPQELIFDDNGIKMYGWFNIQGFPILKIGTYLHLYCNVILPEHQAIVDAYGGLLIIEDRP